MENHIKMTKSFLQLLTKLENSIDTISTSTIDINEVNDGLNEVNDGLNEVNNGSTKVNDRSTEVNDRSTEVNEGFMESSNISCSDIDNIYTQLIHKDDLINKLKEIINCKNDKISTLVKDISEIKNKNEYLEKKIIELTQTVKLLHDNIDRNTIVISNENYNPINYSPHQL
jgi:X-X-X-Leu-X-X-Gly heptad repeat protein